MKKSSDYITCPKCGNDSFSRGVKVPKRPGPGQLAYDMNFICVAGCGCEMAFDDTSKQEPRVFSHQEINRENYPYFKTTIKDLRSNELNIGLWFDKELKYPGAKVTMSWEKAMRIFTWPFRKIFGGKDGENK